MLMLIILPTGHNNYNCHYVKVVSSKTVQTDTTYSSDAAVYRADNGASEEPETD